MAITFAGVDPHLRHRCGLGGGQPYPAIVREALDPGQRFCRYARQDGHDDGAGPGRRRGRRPAGPLPGAGAEGAPVRAGAGCDRRHRLDLRPVPADAGLRGDGRCAGHDGEQDGPRRRAAAATAFRREDGQRRERHTRQGAGEAEPDRFRGRVGQEPGGRRAVRPAWHQPARQQGAGEVGRRHPAAAGGRVRQKREPRPAGRHGDGAVRQVGRRADPLLEQGSARSTRACRPPDGLVTREQAEAAGGWTTPSTTSVPASTAWATVSRRRWCRPCCRWSRG